jgi:hypothetical protein
MSTCEALEVCISLSFSHKAYSKGAAVERQAGLRAAFMLAGDERPRTLKAGPRHRATCGRREEAKRVEGL